MPGQRAEVRPSGPVDGSVTVVVVTWQRRDLVLRCLQSLATQTVACRILVVDNGSTDGTVEAVETTYPRVTVLALPENRGFAGGVAAALAAVDTRFVALLNNDAVAAPRWLEHSLATLEDPSVAAVSAKMVLESPTGSPVTINNTGVVLLDTGYGADRGLGVSDGARFSEVVEVFGFSGGAAVLRTLAVAAVGGFPADWFMYYEDTDVSWRLRLAGWRIVYEPRAVVTHQHAASSDPASEGFAFYTERNRLLTLWENAPLRFAARCSLRFAVTTASIAATRARGRAVPDHHVFDGRLRLRVMRDVAGRLPHVAVERRRAPHGSRRAAVLRDWLGVDSRPTSREP